jgi:hypothetical protein
MYTKFWLVPERKKLLERPRSRLDDDVSMDYKVIWYEAVE